MHTFDSAELKNGKPAPESYESQKSVPVEEASLSSRFFALTLDNILVSAFAAIVPMIIGLSDAALWSTLWAILAVVLPALYFVWPYSSGGQTPGKRTLGIRVVSVDGLSLNWRHGILRYLGYGISGLPLGLGYLWAGWDKYGQAWHDKIAGTVVVKDNVIRIEPLREPEAVRRRQRRWFVFYAFYIIALLLLIVALAARGVFTSSGTEQLAFWPSATESATAIVPPNMSDLDLDPPKIIEAKNSNTLWGEGTYDEGVVAEYTFDGEPAVWVVGLRYEDAETASEAFAGWVVWAEENCNRYRFSDSGASGMITCSYTDAFNQSYFGGNWIVDVVVLDSVGQPPEQFIDQVRDAIVQYWETLK